MPPLHPLPLVAATCGISHIRRPSPSTSVFGGRVFVILGRHIAGDRDVHGIGRQVERCRCYARIHGLEPRASGGSVLIRSGDDDVLAALVAAGCRRELGIVLIENLAVLGTHAQALEAVRALEAVGVELHVIGDGTGRVDKIHLLLADLVDAVQRTRRRNLAAMARRIAVERGGHVGSASYGYRATGTADRIAVDSDKAAVVRRIFDMFDEGLPAAAIARTLNAGGVPSPQGRLWSARAIRGRASDGSGILRNARYAGILVDGRRSITIEKGRRRVGHRRGSDWIVVPKPEWRIVDRTLWERVAIRLRDAAIGKRGALDK